jgi:SAM-dependent methyltransferase
MDAVRSFKRKASHARVIALARVPVKGDVPRISADGRLTSQAFSTFESFESWRAANASLTADWAREDSEAAQDSDSFTVDGFCALCDRSVAFAVSTTLASVGPDGRRVPNWRETLICPNCRMSNRMRAALHVAIQDLGLTATSRIYATEQIGRVYRWLSGHFDDVVGSEYIAADRAPGSRSFGIRHEDVQALSLPTASVDSVITFDVMEHVPDVDAAFASFARVLAPGGRLLMTAPFDVYAPATSVRVVLHEDGTIEHLLPVEMHVNPFDPENGSLCYRHFGWDTLDVMRDLGFAEASVVIYHDRRLGYLGGIQSLVTAVRAS